MYEEQSDLSMSQGLLLGGGILILIVGIIIANFSMHLKEQSLRALSTAQEISPPAAGSSDGGTRGVTVAGAGQGGREDKRSEVPAVAGCSPAVVADASPVVDRLTWNDNYRHFEAGEG